MLDLNGVFTILVASPDIDINTVAQVPGCVPFDGSFYSLTPVVGSSSGECLWRCCFLYIFPYSIYSTWTSFILHVLAAAGSYLRHCNVQGTRAGWLAVVLWNSTLVDNTRTLATRPFEFYFRNHSSMPHQTPERKGSLTVAMEPVKAAGGARLGTISGVYIPVYLNILSILMFLRFGQILGQVGFIGILGKSQI